MNLVKGQHTYPMPPLSYIDAAVIYPKGDPRTNPDAFAERILVDSFANLCAKRLQVEAKTGKDIQGIPRACAVNPIDGTIMFMPTPNADYLVKIRFAGPLQEI